jgi:hypothetical protein
VTFFENLRLEDVTNCDIPAISSRVNSNMKSAGNREVAPYTLVQHSRFDPVQLRQITVEHYSFTANQIDCTLNPLDGNTYC